MKKLAIFDLDGTILDTLLDLQNSVNYALSENGMPERSFVEVRSFVGNGIRKLIERAVVSGTTEEIIEKVFDTFTIHYKEHCADTTKPYDGITDVIKQIREMGIKTAVVSNKADYGVQKLCEDYFNGLFDIAVGDREGKRRKPHPDSVFEVLEKLGIDKEDAVYIGDSDVDYNTSVNADMDVIMVGWGFRDKEFLLKCGAKFVISKPEEIIEHL